MLVGAEQVIHGGQGQHSTMYWNVRDLHLMLWKGALSFFSFFI
jgi:hypothetical protein